MAQVVPRQLVNNLLSLTPEELRQLGRQFLAQRYIEPHPTITRYRSGTIPASTDIQHTINPPEDVEWLLYQVAGFDVQAIDAADRIGYFYFDNTTGYTIALSGVTAISTFDNQHVIWPLVHLTNSTTYATAPSPQPLVLRRRPDKEAGLALIARFITTATVGNRNFEIRMLVRPRSPLNP